MLALAPIALVAFAAVARAQTTIDASQIPQACASDCSLTIEISTLCSQQYEGSNDLASCFCAALPSDISTCSSCLNDNGLTDTATALTQANTACPEAIKACTFSCNFDTCDSTDVECQCGEDYLQNIFDCASCNSEQGNTGVTLLPDYETLATSCAANNYTVPDSADPSPSPTGAEGYTAPTLASSVEDATSTSAIETTAAMTSDAVGSAITSAASSASSVLRSSISRSHTSSGSSASASASAAPTSGAEKVLSASGALGLVALVGFFL